MSVKNFKLKMLVIDLLVVVVQLVNPRAHVRARAVVVGRVGRSVGWSVVCGSVCYSARFLTNSGCCGYQTRICGYVQRELGTARVWSGVVQEQHIYGGGPKIIYMSCF